MLAAFFKAYIVCLVSMLSLYVVVDLFTNLDDFTGKNKPWQKVAIDIAAFYGYRLSQIFDRLCEAIVLRMDTKEQRTGPTAFLRRVHSPGGGSRVGRGLRIAGSGGFQSGGRCPPHQ
jgi:hypothetical protein